MRVMRRERNAEPLPPAGIITGSQIYPRATLNSWRYAYAMAERTRMGVFEWALIKLS